MCLCMHACVRLCLRVGVVMLVLYMFFCRERKRGGGIYRKVKGQGFRWLCLHMCAFNTCVSDIVCLFMYKRESILYVRLCVRVHGGGVVMLALHMSVCRERKTGGRIYRKLKGQCFSSDLFVSNESSLFLG